MAILCDSASGVRYYLYLAPPVPTSFVDHSQDKMMAQLMVWALWRLNPPKPAGIDYDSQDLQHLGGGFRFDASEPGTVDPSERVLTSSRFPPRNAGEFYDSPVLFSIDRTTAWRFIVSDSGVFSTVQVPIQAAQFEFIPFYNSYLDTTQMLQVNNSGSFSVSPLGADQISTNVILFRGGVMYIPDSRFPAPLGVNEYYG